MKPMNAQKHRFVPLFHQQDRANLAEDHYFGNAFISIPAGSDSALRVRSRSPLNKPSKANFFTNLLYCTQTYHPVPVKKINGSEMASINHQF